MSFEELSAPRPPARKSGKLTSTSVTTLAQFPAPVLVEEGDGTM
jgi:hypothetical protein